MWTPLPTAYLTNSSDLFGYVIKRKGFDLSFKLIARIMCITLAFWAAPANTHASHPNDITIRTKAADECFAAKLQDYAARNKNLPVEYGSQTSIYVAEQIVKNLYVEPATGKMKGPLFELSTEDFCKQILFDPYIALLPQALKQQADETRDGLAPFGTDEIEATSIFVQSYQDLIGKHYKGHSDITREAMRRLNASGESFSEPSITLIARASQTPDLYRWNDERYHAHTPDYDPTDLSARQLSIEAGKSKFVGLTCSLLSAQTEQSSIGSVEESLFIFGMLAHAIQDLAFHRGMTMRQHAGLSYAVGRNPDFPDTASAKAIEENAIENTVWIIRLAKTRLSGTQWTAMANWKPLGDFSFRGIASRVFSLKGGPKEQDMKTLALLEYWNLSFPFRTGARPLSELEVTECTATSGLACWNSADVRGTIEHNIERVGNCQ